MPLPGDLTTCRVTGTYLDAAGFPQTGLITFTPSAVITDVTGLVVVPMVPRVYQISAQGTFETDPLVSTDATTVSPEGWTYVVCLTITGQPPQSWNILLPHSSSPVDISTITPVAPQAAVSSYATTSALLAETARAEAAEASLLPLAGGTMSGAIAMGSHKITGLTNGSASSDAAAFGQIPAALPPNGTASGDLSGTYPGPTVAKIQGTVIGSPPGGTTNFLRADGTWAAPAGSGGTVTSVTAGDTSIVVGGTGAAPTIETGTLDVIATDHPPAANWSNNSHKITSLQNGSSAQDAAAFGQLPSSSSPLALGSGGTGTSAASNSALLSTLGAAPLASPALTGTPTAPTAPALTSSTQIATTAYADSSASAAAATSAAYFLRVFAV